MLNGEIIGNFFARNHISPAIRKLFSRPAYRFCSFFSFVSAAARWTWAGREVEGWSRKLFNWSSWRKTFLSRPKQPTADNTEVGREMFLISCERYLKSSGDLLRYEIKFSCFTNREGAGGGGGRVWVPKTFSFPSLGQWKSFCYRFTNLSLLFSHLQHVRLFHSNSLSRSSH